MRKAGSGGSDPTVAAKFIMARSKVKIKEPAAQSTIDAVMFSLRGGAAVLSRDDVHGRLAVIDENQLREMIAVLQKRDGQIAPRWPDEDIEKLVETWMACHG